MPLETLMFAYAGLASLASTAHPHRQTALPGIATPAPATARVAGSALIVASLAAATATLDIPQAIVAWIGAISVAGLALVLLLSRWPQSALTAALPASALGGLLAATRLI